MKSQLESQTIISHTDNAEYKQATTYSNNLVYFNKQMNNYNKHITWQDVLNIRTLAFGR